MRGSIAVRPRCFRNAWKTGSATTIRFAWSMSSSKNSIWPNLGLVGSIPSNRPTLVSSLVLLKLYIYGYLNRVQSSLRLEYEAGRNVEVMWLLCRLVPDHKTIADFRKDNGAASASLCSFYRTMPCDGLLTQASVAIDGSKFKAVTYQYVFQGALIVIAALIYSTFRRRSGA